MKFMLRGASGAAIVGALAAMPVWGQTVQVNQESGPQQSTAAPVEQTGPQTAPPPSSEDRVVVTGSFIAGTPEDAALPVEVYSQADLEKQGAPTALEFIKSLSISGPTSGEAYMFSGAANTGNVAFNLRGLGADKTLTLLNGRRMSENTINIPQAAIGRTEILKDGAAVIYGADATGGVVNFITRDNFTGLEAKANYKWIADSEGDYGLSILGGIGEGQTNFLWSIEWDHRSRLHTLDRDFAQQPYYINPAAAWSSLTELAGWTPRGALPASTAITSANEFGAAVGTVTPDFTMNSCHAVGGVYVSTSSCQYWSIPYYNLVEPQDSYRAYAQLNTSLTENMEFHLDVSYGQLKAETLASPSYPVTRGPARATGAVSQFYVPRANPFVAEFAQRSGLATTAAWTNGTIQGFTPVTYRPNGHGGNAFWRAENEGLNGLRNFIDNQIYRVSGSLKGNLGDWAGAFSEVGYDVGLTYNGAISYIEEPDVLGYRLQEALNGFGGPACSATDLDPVRYGTQNPAAAGKNGCMWWNPFASGWAGQPVLNLRNPNYVAGTENSVELQRWLWDLRAREGLTNSLTLDAVLNSQTPIALPGGNIGVAAGIQGRQIETRETASNDFINGNTPCEWPAQYGQVPRAPSDPLFTGCTPDRPGPYLFYSTDPPDSTDQQQFSVFGEMSIPVLDNLNLQAAVRREEFSGGLGATVYKVSGKWDVWGPLSLRGSYGTNYQAPPAGLVPGEITASQASYTRANGDWRSTQTQTQAGVVPETATAWNAGAIWQSQGFAADHDFRLIVDYFDIETENELGTLATVNDIANIVFAINPTTGQRFVNPNGTPIAGQAAVNNNTALADCSSALVSRVTFNDTARSPGGRCVQGQTNALDFSQIRTDFGNGPGQHVAGFDIQADYSLPLFAGDFTVGVTATNTTKRLLTAKFLDGVQIAPADDRLGFLNFNVVADASPEWRATGFMNYSLEQHNFRFVTNFVSGVVDERGPTTPSGILGVNQFGPTSFGIPAKDWLTFDFHYNFDLSDTLRLSASIANLLDKDPPASRQELSYDARIGNPLGRTVEVSVKKTF